MDRPRDSTSPGEHRGKNVAFNLEVLYPGNIRGSIILKKQPSDPGFDSFATRVCKGLDLQSYNVNPVHDDWIAIEKLDAGLLSFSSTLGTIQTADLVRFQDLSEDQKYDFLNDLGTIFAIEHALAVRDCKAKHVLLDRATDRPFRIDWEYMFAFEPEPISSGIPAFPGECEQDLVKRLTAGPNKAELRASLEAGFQDGLRRIADAVGEDHSPLALLLSEYYPEQSGFYREQILLRCAPPQVLPV